MKLLSWLLIAVIAGMLLGLITWLHGWQGFVACLGPIILFGLALYYIERLK